jgi:porphobilinogen synthase
MATMAELTLRRMRMSRALRQLSREVRLAPEQFIQPLFVVEKSTAREAIPGLTNVWRDTPASLLQQIESDLSNGIDKFLLFGVPAQKFANDFDHSFVAEQIKAVKSQFGDNVWLAVDVCLCSSTTHGHCGVLNAAGTEVVNTDSVVAIANAADLYARAGADCVAPSDMMDGRVAAIRSALDAAANNRTVIMSYAAKFHSGFYGPFRIAADSTPNREITLSDRSSYQIDPTRPTDALLSAQRDRDEGADILMVKPALPYLDVLSSLTSEIHSPWAVYQTSGEAAGIDLVAAAGLGARDQLYIETWTACARAGATSIISYAARDATQWLKR